MKTNFIKQKTTIAAIIIAAIALCLRLAARNISVFSDLYHGLMTEPMVQIFGRISNLFPFAVVEILIFAILIGLLLFLLQIVVRLIRRLPLRALISKGISIILLIAALIGLLYEGGEDVYFYTTTFSTTYGFGSGSYTTEELAEICQLLAARVNEKASLVSRDENGLMTNEEHLELRTASQMILLGESYDLIQGWYPKTKGLMLSWLMSETNMTGIYSAYTKEANYNTLMPAYNMAFTMCHELSHLRGVMQENEANFVAYLACRNASDHDIAYSGALLGWIYCGNELYKRDKELWNEIALTLDDSVNLDLNYNTWYWNQYKGKAAEAAENFNDAYLKQAGQADGVESYNKVVDLIVSYEVQAASDS